MDVERFFPLLYRYYTVPHTTIYLRDIFSYSLDIIVSQNVPNTFSFLPIREKTGKTNLYSRYIRFQFFTIHCTASLQFSLKCISVTFFRLNTGITKITVLLWTVPLFKYFKFYDIYFSGDRPYIYIHTYICIISLKCHEEGLILKILSSFTPHSSVHGKMFLESGSYITRYIPSHEMQPIFRTYWKQDLI
jgi:hypothetical protein